MSRIPSEWRRHMRRVRAAGSPEARVNRCATMLEIAPWGRLTAGTTCWSLREEIYGRNAIDGWSAERRQGRRPLA